MQFIYLLPLIIVNADGVPAKRKPMNCFIVDLQEFSKFRNEHLDYLVRLTREMNYERKEVKSDTEDGNCFLFSYVSTAWRIFKYTKEKKTF